MRKTISLIAILLCFASTYAQDTKPTKQETMDFIANKLKNYLVSPREFVSYSDGIFKYALRNIAGTKEVTKYKTVKSGYYQNTAIPKYEKQEYTEEVDINCGFIIFTLDLNKVTKLDFWEAGSGVTKSNNYDKEGNFTGVVDKVYYSSEYFSIVGKAVFNRNIANYNCKEDEEKTEFDDFTFSNKEGIDIYKEDGLPIRMKKAFELLVQYNKKSSDGGLFMD